MTELGYGLFDADNHYYETPDCFTRHMEAAHRDDAIRVEQRDGVDVAVFRDRVLNYAAVELTRDAEPPGSLMSILKSRNLRSRSEAKVAVPHVPAYIDRRARLALMDEQGVDATVMLPSFGVSVEQEMADAPAAVMANFRAFNRWVEEEWGYGADGRVFGVPLLSLLDRDAAVAELDRVLAAGAKVVYLRPGHVNGRSPADAHFDPFWARVNEAGVPVAFHLSGGLVDQSAVWGEVPNPHHKAMSAFQFGFFFCDRPIMDTLGTLILNDIFGRFPDLKILSIENGSSWIPYFEKILHKGWRMAPFGPAPWGRPADRPVDVFREKVWVAPFPEEDNAALVRRMGSERVLFGSDFPHAEGTEQPIDFVHSLEGLPAEDVRNVMRSNLAGLLGAA